MPLTMVSVVFLMLAWMLVSIMGDTFFYSMAKTSSTIASFSGDYGSLIAMLIVPSVVALLIANILYLRKPFVFFLLLSFSFTMAEAFIPVLHELALLIRYLFMVTIIAFGFVNITTIFRRPITLQWLGLLMLLWVLLHVLSNGFSASSMAMLPIQFTMYIGLMIGLVESVKERERFYSLLAALAWAGAAATTIHFIALAINDRAFLAGRFRSYYMLPTNFANNYVLLVAAMLWYGMYQKQAYKSISFFILAAFAAYLLVLSGTRNSMVALVIAGCSLSFLWQRKYIAFAGVTALLGGLTIIAVGFDGGGLGEASNRLTNVDEEETRFSVWARAIEYILQKPFWGYGLDVNMAQLDSRLPEWMKFDAHNAYLGLWLRLGFLGMLYILFVYIWSAVKGLKLLLSSSVSMGDKGLIVLPVTILGMLFVAGLFEENLSSKGNTQQFVMALSVGLLIAYNKNLRVRSRRFEKN